MGALVKWVFKTALSRWVTGGLVIFVLGGAGLMWHNHKEGLRAEGAEECIQQITQANVTVLENKIADQATEIAVLLQLNAEKDAANERARTRHQVTENRVAKLLRDQARQEQEDETYAEWSNIDLPNGVAERLRSTQTSATGTDTRPNGI